jgi:hypothetical protein
MTTHSLARLFRTRREDGPSAPGRGREFERRVVSEAP